MTEYSFIAQKILEWGEKNLREFPWRYSENPYEILISEIMLQRTNAKQVATIYSDFIRKYPSFKALSTTPYEEIYNQLKSLGLTWRVKKLYSLSEIILSKYGGVIPKSREILKTLPGIGDYISGAYLINAYNKKVPLLDTNIVRVLSRVFALPQKDNSRKNKQYLTLMENLISNAHPRLFLYSIIDLAALICTPKNPKCFKCPLSGVCKHSN